MSSIFSWLGVMFVIVALGALGGAILTWIGRRLIAKMVENIEPRARFWIYGGLAFLPLVAGLVILLVAFYPSFLQVLGIASDHCLSHEASAFHLCFLHFAPPTLFSIWGILAVVLMSRLAWNWSGELRAVRRANRWSRGLMNLATFDGESATYVVDSERPLALTTGLFQRQIILSKEMHTLLSPKQLSAVLAHERTHKQRFDGLTTLIFRLVVSAHFPAVRREILSAIELANEQICDEEAAREVGDPLVVAEAILAVERASRASFMPAAVLCFGSHCVEKRVFGLLRSEWSRLDWSPLAAIGLLAGVVVLLNLHDLHHLIEHSLSGLF